MAAQQQAEATQTVQLPVDQLVGALNEHVRASLPYAFCMRVQWRFWAPFRHVL